MSQASHTQLPHSRPSYSLHCKTTLSLADTASWSSHSTTTTTTTSGRCAQASTLSLCHEHPTRSGLTLTPRTPYTAEQPSLTQILHHGAVTVLLVLVVGVRRPPRCLCVTSIPHAAVSLSPLVLLTLQNSLLSRRYRIMEQSQYYYY